jgi:hypothetical protein
MIWQVLNLRKYFVWICQGYQVNLVRQKGFLPIASMNMDFRSINADFMVDRIQTSMALGIEQIEEGITSQVIQMRRRLNLLQV